MPRKLKPQQVDEVFHSDSGTRVPIMFDRNTLEFFAEFEGETFTDPVAVKLRTPVMDAIKAASSLTWERAIAVIRPRETSSHFNPFDMHAAFAQGSMEFAFCIFDWAKRRDGKIVRRSVYSDNQGTIYEFRTGGPVVWLRAPKDFAPPVFEDRTVYLPYTQEVWAALWNMKAALESARKRLDELVSTTEGTILLASNGAATLLALPQPTPEPQSSRVDKETSDGQAQRKRSK